MLMNLLEENGNVSKYWELVPLARSYSVRVLRSPPGCPCHPSLGNVRIAEVRYLGSGPASNGHLP